MLETPCSLGTGCFLVNIQAILSEQLHSCVCILPQRTREIQMSLLFMLQLVRMRKSQPPPFHKCLREARSELVAPLQLRRQRLTIRLAWQQYQSRGSTSYHNLMIQPTSFSDEEPPALKGCFVCRHASVFFNFNSPLRPGNLKFKLNARLDPKD
jgi:hypothetical protein